MTLSYNSKYSQKETKEEKFFYVTTNEGTPDLYTSRTCHMFGGSPLSPVVTLSSLRLP